MLLVHGYQADKSVALNDIYYKALLRFLFHKVNWQSLAKVVYNRQHSALIIIYGFSIHKDNHMNRLNRKMLNVLLLFCLDYMVGRKL